MGLIVGEGAWDGASGVAWSASDEERVPWRLFELLHVSVLGSVHGQVLVGML